MQLLYVLTEYVTGYITDVFTQIVLRSILTRKQDSSTSKNRVTNIYAITYREDPGAAGRGGGCSVEGSVQPFRWCGKLRQNSVCMRATLNTVYIYVYE